MQNEELSKIHDVLVASAIHSRVVGGVLEFQLLANGDKIISDPLVLSSWKNSTCNDPRELRGYRIRGWGEGLRHILTLSPAFKHDSPSDCPIHPRMEDAIKMICNELRSLNGKPIILLDDGFENSYVLAEEETSEQPIVQDKCDELFRLLRANHYRLLPLRPEGFIIVPGPCQNLSALKDTLSTSVHAKSSSWTFMESQETTGDNRWIVTVKPSYNVVLHSPEDTFPSLVEALIAGVKHSAAQQMFREEQTGVSVKASGVTYTEEQVKSLIAIIRPDLNLDTNKPLVDKLLSVI